MALHPDNPYWIPGELLVTIVKFLPVRCRRALMCVSKEHGNVIDMWRDKTYGSFWLTEEQETLVSEILREPKGIVHLKAPPSTGKTGIVLAAALGKGGFVPEGDILLVAVASGLVGVWASEIARMFPFKKVLKVCSGGVSYEDGVLMLKEDRFTKERYDVVVATPVWSHRYMLQKTHKSTYPGSRTTFSYENNIPFRWMILDEAHRDGTTEVIVSSAQDKRYSHLQFLILLTANTLRKNNPTDDDRAVIRLLELSAMPSSSLPLCIKHFHGGSEYVPYDNSEQETQIKRLIAVGRNGVYGGAICNMDKTRDIVEMTIRLTVACVARSIVSEKDNHRILCFVPRIISLSARIMAVVPIILGYKIFTMRGGAHNITVIEEFHARTGKSILFATYKGGATGFSIDADEVFLMGALQSTQTYVYQACKRIERVTNPRPFVYAHYVETNIYRAIFSYHAAELSVLGMKVLPSTWLSDSIDIIALRFDILCVDSTTCSSAVFLAFCHPYFDGHSAIIQYIKNNLTPRLIDGLNDLVRCESNYRDYRKSLHE